LTVFEVPKEKERKSGQEKGKKGREYGKRG